MEGEQRWADPGPVAGPFTATLEDGSTITFHWYRFVDQPSLQQFDWSVAERAALQNLVEAIHANWSIDQDYMAPPDLGLVTIDPALVVDPPAGPEIGYVPIVTRREG